jgi:hypothetical protein
MERDFAGPLMFSGLLAIALNALTVAPAYAEFPPEGAVSDPNNPSVATGDLPDPSHKGTLRHYIFYFDCGKRHWIGVSVTGTVASPASPPQAVGLGREFPPGPPLGSKTVNSNPSRAMSALGQAFVLENGSWFDAKTKKPVPSPKLCPATDHPGRRAAEQAPGSEHDQSSAGAGSDKLPPAQPARQNEQKPDQLPPPPKYMPSNSSSHP